MRKLHALNLSRETISKVTFLLRGRALNLGTFAIISSSISAELLSLTERTRWDVSNSGVFGLVSVSLGFLCIAPASLWSFYVLSMHKLTRYNILWGSTTGYLWNRATATRQRHLSCPWLELPHHFCHRNEWCCGFSNVHLHNGEWVSIMLISKSEI